MNYFRQSSSENSSENEENVILIRRKVYRPRINFHFGSVFEFNERFRLNSTKIESIISNIGPLIRSRTLKNMALPPKEQLLVALRWLCNGGQYHTISDTHGISKATVCRCVHRVARAVNATIFNRVVSWPTDNVGLIAEKFAEIAGMPWVCGCVDGTLIQIDAPTEYEAQYVDRHGKHSINCMVVSGPDLTFYCAYVNWPGSVHDARVLRNSSLYGQFENGYRPFRNAVILGDSAYRARDWLVTPLYGNQLSTSERRYSAAHKSTRRTVENSIGILKEKFPCLNRLRMTPIRAVEVIKCCIAFCNIARSDDDVIVVKNEGQSEVSDTEEEDEDNISNEIDPNGQRRVRIMINHFT